MKDKPDAPPVVDELGRVAVVLPEDSTLYGGVTYLAVAIERGPDGETRMELIGRGLNYCAGWEVISLLCDDRAQRTVDHALLVCGRPVTPERYLGLWRQALREAIPPQRFVETYGLVPTACLGGALAANRGAAAPWTTSPFATFDEFEAAYRSRMEVGPGEQHFRLELDLSAPLAARDAFYAEAFIRRYDGPKEPAPVAELVLKPAAGGAAGGLRQGQLFPEPAAA